MSLVKRLVSDDAHVGRPHFLESQSERDLSSLEVRCEAPVEADFLGQHPRTGPFRFGAAEFGKRHVLPPGEAVVEVPLRLTVAKKN
jgi:hypothetical protein